MRWRSSDDSLLRQVIHVVCWRERVDALALLRRFERDSGIELVNGQRHVRRRERHLFSRTNLALLPSLRRSLDDRDLRTTVRDEDHRPNARDLHIVAKLFAAIVVLARWARYFHQECRVNDGIPIDRRQLTLAANDRDIGEGRQMRCSWRESTVHVAHRRPDERLDLSKARV